MFVAPKEPTQPQPFRFTTASRAERHAAAREEAEQQQLEQQQQRRRRLSAARAPPPTTDMPAVPPRPPPRAPTVPAPYQLRSEALHAAAAARLAEQLAREEAARRAAAEFKARPMWDGRPFEPRESGAPLTVPDDVELATEERAGERAEFDRGVAERMRAEEVRARVLLLLLGRWGDGVLCCALLPCCLSSPLTLTFHNAPTHPSRYHSLLPPLGGAPPPGRPQAPPRRGGGARVPPHLGAQGAPDAGLLRGSPVRRAAGAQAADGAGQPQPALEQAPALRRPRPLDTEENAARSEHCRPMTLGISNRAVCKVGPKRGQTASI